MTYYSFISYHQHHMRASLLRSVQPRGITYTHNGSPSSVLRVSTLPPLPTLSNEQIRVKYLLSPFNPADMNVIQGVYPAKPQTVELNNSPQKLGGNEAVAQVVEVGSGVDVLKPSDWVIMGKSQLGTWRSSAVLNTNDVIKLPPSTALSKVHAATLAINPPTALRMLSDFVSLKPGDYIIQTGANSAVGTSVIQIAKSMNVHTINLVRERGSREETEALVIELKNMGATHVLTNEDIVNDSKRVRGLIKDWTQGKELKLALNCVGGQETTELVKTLSEGAYLVTYGAMSKKPLSIPPGLHIFKVGGDTEADFFNTVHRISRASDSGCRVGMRRARRRRGAKLRMR